MAVLFGGASSEREVSAESGRRMLEALRSPPGRSHGSVRGGLSGESARPAEVLGVPVDADGRWRVNDLACSPAAALEQLERIDLFVLALHGGAGENGEIQGLLSANHRAWTGSGVLGSSLAMDKELTRSVVEREGLRVARGRVGSDPRALAMEVSPWPCAGWVTKPRSGGSSVGASLVLEADDLERALGVAMMEGGEALVEERILGVEVAAGVLETPDRGLESLPLVEIRPHAGRLFDYEEKYSQGGAVELCPPESVVAETCCTVQQMARTAHRTLRCDGYSRSDFIVPADGSAPVFLELNTLPGMTPRSLLPQAADVAGIDYRTLCRWIAADALQRRAR